MKALLAAAVLTVCAPAAGAAGGLQLDGHFTQGGLVYGRALPGTEVRLDGHAVRISPDGAFLLGFGREAPSSARLELRYPDGERETRELHVARREYAIQHIDGLPSAMVTPSAAELARIRSDQALVEAARARDTAVTYFESGFEWPTRGPISGVYGSQRILNGEPRQPHYGVDIAVPAGTPVHAPADGVVSLARTDMYYTGGTLMIDHGHGLSSAFLHLSRLHVAEGDRVRRGDLIGEVGATGRATGAHLDWRINLFETRIDAQLVAGPMPAADGR